MVLVIKVKNKLKGFLKAYHSLPDCFTAILLIGCEVCIVLFIAAMLFRGSNPNLSDTLGMLSVRSIIVSVLVAVASCVVRCTYHKGEE